MNFIKSEMDAHAGDVVEVALQGNAANVMLMERHDFESYQRGSNFRYVGGYFKRSPVRLAVPSNGHWFVVVDIAGYPGHVKASIKLLSASLA